MAAVSRRPRRAKSGHTDAEAVPSQPIDIDFLDRIIGYSLRRAQAAVYADYARTVGGLGVRPAQFAALVIINANPGLTQSALAACMGIDRSAAVGLIDFLENGGWVARVPSPTDRRSYSIMITVPGQEMLERLKALVADSDARLTSRLSDQEREVLLDLLRRLY